MPLGTLSSRRAFVYAAITVLPNIYRDIPYTSPFSALVWYISRKAMAWLKMVGQMTDFVKKHTSMGQRSAVLPQSGKEPIGNESTLKERLTRYYMTKATNYVALRSDKGLIVRARAVGWTLDKWMKEANWCSSLLATPCFPVPLKLKTPWRSLKRIQNTVNLISVCIATSQISLYAPQNLGCYRTPSYFQNPSGKICLEALYFLPGAIKSVLRRAADKDNKPVINALLSFSPLLQSVESWRIAERLSTSNRRIHPDVTVAAQCVVAVLASQTPDDRTVMQLSRANLKIKHRDDYMSHPAAYGILNKV